MSSDRAGSDSGPVIVIPPGALVVLVGASGAGKSTFAARNFLPTEVVSSDALRAMIADDEAAQDATGPAFHLVHEIAALRIARRRLTVIDATNVNAAARRPLVAMARRHGRPTIAVVLHPPLQACLAANAHRPGRSVPRTAVETQHRAVERSRPGLRGEGFTVVVELRSLEAIASASIDRPEMPIGRTASPP